MQFKKILVPIDFSHFSKKALDSAVELGHCCKGKIFLLHVEEDIFCMRRIHQIHPPLEEVCDKIHDDLILEKKKHLEKFKQSVPADLLEDTVLKEGHPFVEIVKFAREQCIDLIVMSTRGRSNIKHALLGSTTEKVLRKAECAVFVIRDKKCKPVLP